MSAQPPPSSCQHQSSFWTGTHPINSRIICFEGWRLKSCFLATFSNSKHILMCFIKCLFLPFVVFLSLYTFSSENRAGGHGSQSLSWVPTWTWAKLCFAVAGLKRSDRPNTRSINTSTDLSARITLPHQAVQPHLQNAGVSVLNKQVKSQLFFIYPEKEKSINGCSKNFTVFISPLLAVLCWFF